MPAIWIILGEFGGWDLGWENRSAVRLFIGKGRPVEHPACGRGLVLLLARVRQHLGNMDGYLRPVRGLVVTE